MNNPSSKTPVSGSSNQSPRREKPSASRQAASSRQRKSASRASSSRNASYQKTGGSSSARRRRIYRKSRRYRQRQKKLMLMGGAGLILLIVLLVFAFRGFKNKEAVPADTQTESTASKTDKATKKKADGSSQNEAESEPSSVPAEPVSFTVSVVGDCTLGTDENFDYSTSLNAYYESNGPDYFLQNVKSIFESDDLTIANFEGTLTDSEEREEKQFAFKAPADFSSILSSGSVEAVTLANNHSHDYGEQGFSDTRTALDQEGIVHFGYDETAVVEIKGIKVGLVGIYELHDHLERTEQLKQNIAKVKEKGAQFTIVIFHWGNEKEEVPDSNQTTLGRLAIDLGADLVCGHHPHVLQGYEAYKGKNIVYSLGNFCFGGNSYPSDMDTMIFQQTFTIDQNGVKNDNEINIIPCSISSDYDYNNYQPTPAQDDEAQRIMAKINERSSWITPAQEEDMESEEKGAPSLETENTGE